MVWPPTIPPNDRLNDTVTADNHPLDHNTTSDALTELVAQVDDFVDLVYVEATRAQTSYLNDAPVSSLTINAEKGGWISSGGVLTVPVDGIYLIQGGWPTGGVTATPASCGLWIIGAGASALLPGVAGTTVGFHTQRVMRLSAGDGVNYQIRSTGTSISRSFEASVYRIGG